MSELMNKEKKWMLWALTGHGTSQYSSVQPGEQAQVPLTGLQDAPLAHWHVWLQLSPQVPLEQGMEQSTPCQPAQTTDHFSLKWNFILQLSILGFIFPYGWSCDFDLFYDLSSNLV